MALLDAPDFFGNTIFCDDIRMEADGKLFYIGVYSSQLFVHADFPVSLPKFGFGITFYQKKKIFDPKLGIRIFLPQDPDDKASIQAELSETEQGSMLANAMAASGIKSEEEDNPHAIITLRSNLIFSPFILSMPGTIKVRIARGDDLVRLGALEILRAPPAPAPIKA